MTNTIERYQADIQRLVKQGGKLFLAMQRTISDPPDVKTNMSEDELNNLPDFNSQYQAWYSESISVISQILPERLDDFKSYYAHKTSPKSHTYANYTISDYLRGLTVRINGKIVVDPAAALSLMYQQYNIISGLENRFTSTLYDIRTLLHADLMDDELHAAEELNRNGFQRGAGAMAGVVLEGHLGAVCVRHQVTLRKKDPSIADLNDALKNASIADVAQWRFIQHLGDLRNKCDHKKSSDPSKEEVSELIDGVRKITKTLT